VSDAAHGFAAESAQADFANFQRRIHSLQRADGTLPDQNRKEHHLAPVQRITRFTTVARPFAPPAAA
jgi:hypothetical protein